MKKSIIPWHVFRAALQGQNPDGLEHWLDHWGFTNDGAVLISVAPHSGSPALSLQRHENGPVAAALNPPASLGELLQLLTRDANLFMDDVAKRWSYMKEL